MDQMAEIERLRVPLAACPPVCLFRRRTEDTGGQAASATLQSPQKNALPRAADIPFIACRYSLFFDTLRGNFGQFVI
jgi:hypothetical protein